jgi:adenylosuccinate synthase
MDETAYKELPESARTYVEQVERLIGLPVTQVTVGPGRDQAINRDGVHAGYA